jgi:hypothetical protein
MFNYSLLKGMQGFVSRDLCVRLVLFGQGRFDSLEFLREGACTTRRFYVKEAFRKAKNEKKLLLSRGEQVLW